MKKGTIIDFDLRIVKISGWSKSKFKQPNFADYGNVRTIEMESAEGAKYLYRYDTNKISEGSEQIKYLLQSIDDDSAIIPETIVFCENDFMVDKINGDVTTVACAPKQSIRLKTITI